MMPKRVMTKLVYFDYKYLSVATVGYCENVYRMGSIFDPDYSGVGT